MDEAMDMRDRALQMSCPMVAAPRFGARHTLRENGQRLLVANNGIFMEVRRAWLHCIRRVGTWKVGMNTPFGKVDECLTLTFGKIRTDLLANFVRHGRAALPCETAGAIVFDDVTGYTELVMHGVMRANGAGVDYVIGNLDKHKHIVVDLHTHAVLPAFFSKDDDWDDRGGVKLAGVFGNLDSEKPTCAFRLCMNGVFENLPVPETVARRGGVVAQDEVDGETGWPTLTSLGFFGA
jgi:PRTRC genetic system protein A